MSDLKFQSGDPPTDRGPIVGIPQDDLIAKNKRIKELEYKLAKAVEEKECTIDTLNAWFDRRKLGHKAVDQAIVDAASGYLRTSRNGGMPQEESDLILGVMQDMARLGLFADLFARATLAKLEDKTDE